MSQGNDYGLSAKRPQTVDLPDTEVIDALDKLATEAGVSRRKYIQGLLKNHVDKSKFLSRYFPTFRKITVEDGKLFVWDQTRKTTAEVGLKNGRIFCNMCESESCPHVLFTWATDDISYLDEFNHKKPKIELKDFEIFETKIKLDVKGEEKPIILEVDPTEDGNILKCNHCVNPNCIYRSYVLNNKEFWDFLKSHGVKIRRVRDY